MKYTVRLLFGLFLNTLILTSHAQKISGKVVNDAGVPLPFASILIKNSIQGTTSNKDGQFFLPLSPGTYIVICQYIGYERKETTITIKKEDVTIDFQLTQQQYMLPEVVVTQNSEDPAYEIIRNAIKKRPYYLKQLDTFQCEVYNKGQFQLRDHPNKFLGKKVDFEDGDSSKQKMLYLSESIIRYSVQNNQEKEEVISTKVSGSSNGFGLSFPHFISLYQNNISLGQGLNPRGFISPIADNALTFYRYKYQGNFFEDGKEIHRIKVIPKRKYEPLFAGYINITENDWRIHSTDLLLTKESQMQMLDTLHINQLYVPYDKNVWVMKTQVIYPAMKMFGFEGYGSFVNIYSKYDIKPGFKNKFFDNTILKYVEGSNKKSLQYWDTIRPIPLQDAEQRDYVKKDSLEKVKQNPHYKDSIDKVRNKVALSDIVLFGQSFSKEKKHSYFTIYPLFQSLSFNTVEGWAANVKMNYTKHLDSTGYNKHISISPLIRYGFSNTHFNAYVDAEYSTYNTNVTIGGGKNVFQFNNSNPISPFFNTFSTLIWENNYMKLYEAWTGNISYSQRIVRGITGQFSFKYQDRIPLENTAINLWKDWENRSYTPNYPIDIMYQNFTRHQASILSLGLQWKPGTKYIEFPDKRFETMSKYPTFSAGISMGLKNVLGSDVDYGKWHVGIKDNLNLKILGTFKYNISAGGFYRVKDVQTPDYKHFDGNQITVIDDYTNKFLLLPYYKFSNTATMYGEAHAEYHLNGLLTNKIPLFRKLNWNLVSSAHTFYINKQANYLEATVGLENILKIFRVDFGWGFENGKSTYTGFRLGIGGGLFASRKRQE